MMMMIPMTVPMMIPITMMLMMMMMAIGKYGGIWVCLSARLSEVDLDGELCGRRDDHHTHDDDDDVLTNQLEGFIIYF